MVCNIGVTGGAEQNGVVAPDQVTAILRHHAAVRLIVRSAPVEMVEPEREPAIAPGKRVEDLDAGGYDFCSDAITGNGCDFVRLHALMLLSLRSADDAIRYSPTLKVLEMTLKVLEI